MSPDNDEALRIAAEAWELCEAEAWDEAIEKYQESVQHLDHGHSRAQDILGEFAMALSKVGRHEEAETHLRLALDSAIRSDGAMSLSATIARYFLADSLLRREKRNEAQDLVEEWLDVECGGRWLMNYVAATLAYLDGNKIKFQNLAVAAFNDAPKSKWSSPAEVEARIEEEFRG